ncbi:MAG: molybdenum cofactor guanylyltransferase [Chloroflexi bacterium]|nr:molybdenum cofactor guanylyltransferase [Chloroflexota bacterium]
MAIIAGGQSSRMGRDKSFVELAGQPVIKHVMERVEGLGQAETILITNHMAAYAHLDLPMFSDVLPDKGSLGGIYTAIYYSQQPHTLVVACDMPLLNTDLLRYMVGLLDDETDVIVPTVEGYPQGLHAIYGKECLDLIQQRLEANRLKVIGFYGDVQVRYIDEAEYQPIDPHGHSFFNVNTPEDLERARQLIGS